MVVEQRRLVEEALLARTRLRARRAYVQALKDGANRAVAFEAAVDSLLEAHRAISEAEARGVVGHEIENIENERERLSLLPHRRKPSVEGGARSAPVAQRHEGHPRSAMTSTATIAKAGTL